jgi:protection of telomeres protein 1
LSAPEVIYGITLANALSHHRASEVIRPSPSRSLPPVPQLAPGGRKFSLIKDVQIAKFYDIVGEVVKTFPNGSGLEVYVSDYTLNENLFNYEWSPPSLDDCGGPGDEYGYIGRRTNQSWPGPYGKLTLRVILWPPHSTAAQSTVKEGDYVELKNVRIKFDRCTHLEGAIHGDRQFPDRINIRRIDDKKDERYLAVLKRKRSYGKRFDKQKGDFLEEVGKSLKRPNDRGDEEGDISRRRLKKRRSEERKVAQNREESQVPRKGQPEETSGAWGLAQRRRTEEIKSERENKIATANLRFAVNKNGTLNYLPTSSTS